MGRIIGVGLIAALLLAASCGDLPPEYAAGPTESPGAQDAGKACAKVGPRYRIFANVEWCDTGLVLKKGQRVTVTAGGSWSNSGGPFVGPEGYKTPFGGTILEGESFASLIGQIGTTLVPLGRAFDGPAAADGALWLAMNDVAGAFADNRGFVDVNITIGN